MTIRWDIGSAPADAEPPKQSASIAAMHARFCVPPIVVLITSAPHRRESLMRVLDALGQQTLKPIEVLLVLDGKSDSMAPLVPAKQLPLSVEHREVARGPGARWEHPGLKHLVSETIVITLDDDLVPHSQFIERTVWNLLTENCIITWHGWEHDISEGGLDTSPERDVECIPFGCGAAAYRWRWFDCFLDHQWRRIVDRGAQSDDDALLALAFYEAGIRVLRPAGPAPLTELPASNAPDAGYRVHGDFRHGQRLAFALASGIDVCMPHFPPPPEAMDGWAATSSIFFWNVAAQLRWSLRRALDASKDELIRHYWLQLRDALDALKPGQRVLQLEVGPYTRWVALYCVARGIDYAVSSSVPQLQRALSMWVRYEKPPEREFDLTIVAPFVDPHARAVAFASNVVRLR